MYNVPYTMYNLLCSVGVQIGSSCEKKEENKTENKSLSITICTTYLMPHSTDKLYIVNCK